MMSLHAAKSVARFVQLTKGKIMELVKSKFFFKASKVKDDAGNVVMVPEEKVIKGKDGKPDTVEIAKDKNGNVSMVPKMTTPPEPLELNVPLLTSEDIIKILNEGNEKAVRLLNEACNAVILEQAREQVNEAVKDEKVEELREKGFNLDALLWQAIADLPPATRRGAAIPEEKWEGFAADYISVVVHHGKTEEKAKTAAKLFTQKYQPVKSNKKVVAALKDNLQLWFANTSDESRETYQDIYENLMQKADTLLEKDEDAIVAAI